nr:hypothetical protein [Tanacetum cinerariifolium]
SIRFKIDTRKSVLDLEAFREMLHISPIIPNQPFADLPTEEEVLDFLRINIDFAYLIWEDFVYQVEHKSQKRSNEMNYPRFTKVVSRHQATKQYGAILPIELTTAEIRNSKAYQEYHACAMGEAAPKPKASARKKKGDSASSTTPPTPTLTTTAESAPRLSAAAKGKQPSRATLLGSGTGEGTGSKPGVSDVPSDDSEEELSWKSSDNEEVGGHKEGKEFDNDSDEGSDNGSDETVKSGAGKDGDEDDDEDDNDDDK